MNYELILETINTCIKFNQTPKLKQKAKNNAEKVFLGLSILELSKTVMYELWYDYVKPKYGENANFVMWIPTAILFM